MEALLRSPPSDSRNLPCADRIEAESVLDRGAQGSRSVRISSTDVAERPQTASPTWRAPPARLARAPRTTSRARRGRARQPGPWVADRSRGIGCDRERGHGTSLRGLDRASLDGDSTGRRAVPRRLRQAANDHRGSSVARGEGPPLIGRRRLVGLVQDHRPARVARARRDGRARSGRLIVGVGRCHGRGEHDEAIAVDVDESCPATAGRPGSDARGARRAGPGRASRRSAKRSRQGRPRRTPARLSSLIVLRYLVRQPRLRTGQHACDAGRRDRRRSGRRGRCHARGRGLVTGSEGRRARSRGRCRDRVTALGGSASAIVAAGPPIASPTRPRAVARVRPREISESPR